MTLAPTSSIPTSRNAAMIWCSPTAQIVTRTARRPGSTGVGARPA